MKTEWIYIFIFTFIVVGVVLVSSINLDINHDGVINIKDLQILASHFEGRLAYNSTFDLNGNGKVDLFDVVSEARHINNTNPGAVTGGNASLISHMPSGMTLIGEDNGTVLSSTGVVSTGHAFGISSFGNWWQFNGDPLGVFMVNDTTNPTGTGKVIRFDYSYGSNNNTAGIASTPDSGFGGPWHQFYVALSIYYEPGFFDQDGAKIYYFAPNYNASAHGGGTPNDYYLQNNPIYLVIQHGGTSHNGILNITGDDSTPTGQWLNWEFLAVAESTPGAGDGYFTIWKNGALVSNDTGIQWLNPGESPNGFDGMEYYAHASPTITMDRYYRLGHLIIAGKN